MLLLGFITLADVENFVQYLVVSTRKPYALQSRAYKGKRATAVHMRPVQITNAIYYHRLRGSASPVLTATYHSDFFPAHPWRSHRPADF